MEVQEPSKHLAAEEGLGMVIGLAEAVPLTLGSAYDKDCTSLAVSAGFSEQD